MKIEYIIAILVVLALFIAFILIKKIQADNIKTDLIDINVRFNAVKTVPLAFKLNKATYIAKINEETAAQVEVYREKYDTCQKNIAQLQALIDGIEDDIAVKNTKQAKSSILVVKEMLKDSEEEVKNIEDFLDTITQREHVQREYSNQLKDKYRELKQLANEHINELSIAYDGIEDELKNCEELFSSFEEQIYANEFMNAQEDLEKIAVNLNTIDNCIKEVPELINKSKGIIPVLVDEVMRSFALNRQRGLYHGHLMIEERLQNCEATLNANLKGIVNAKIEGVDESLNLLIDDLNALLKSLDVEYNSFNDTKANLDKITSNLEAINKTYNYIEQVYTQDKEKYGLDELDDVLTKELTSFESFKNASVDLIKLLDSGTQPASSILSESIKLFDETNESLDRLLGYKHTIDRTTNDENHANTQIVKLQIVLNEVEVKIAQYRLPAISNSYKDDLARGHEYVKEIKTLLAAIPLNVDELNAKLKEAIDFIYKLYNNVNNVVGMALMVENAIVFGNKYRSSYPEVDAELSKAEFAYMNGEYTQSLTIAIACIEKLFPKSGDDKIMEYTKSE